MGRLLILAVLAAAFSISAILSAPDISQFDKTPMVNENAQVNVLLSTIACTDPDGDPVSVTVQTVNPTAPCTNCFEVLTCAPDFCLEYRAGVGTLVYRSVQYYLVRVACVDNIEAPAYETIQVTVNPNTPPYFDPGTLVSNPLNAASTAAGQTIYTAAAIDDDVDTITYSLQVIPSQFSSAFVIDSNSGEIKTTVDLRAVCHPVLTMLVTASDGMASSRPLVIDSPISNANIAPVAMNLNTEVEIPEDKAGTVYLMDFKDTDALTYTYTNTNAAGFAQFTMIGDPPNIDTAAALNYEDASLRQTYMTVKASDGFCESPTYYLRLVVTDVNEPPIISPNTSTVSVCEGQVEHDPGLTVTDPDVPDTTKWDFHPSFNNVRGRFYIDQAAGWLKTNVDYDVDQNNMPSRSTQIITVEDKGGLTATAEVTVNYLDCNDNYPYFDGVTDQHFKTFYATECTAGGAVLGTIVAKDIDSAREGNNVLTYSGSAGCCIVDTQGRVIVNSVLPAGNVVTFNGWAHDQGQTPGPKTSLRPCVITVVFTVCPTPVTTVAATTSTTTTVNPNIDFTETFENIPWIVVAALLFTLFLGLLTYMIWKYCSLPCKNCKCKRPVQRAKPPPKQPNRPPAERPVRDEPELPPPPAEPAKPAFLWGFWKQDYLNQDAHKGPSATDKPKPTHMRKVEEHTYEPAEEPAAAPTQAQGGATGAKNSKWCAIL